MSAVARRVSLDKIMLLGWNSFFFNARIVNPVSEVDFSGHKKKAKRHLHHLKCDTFVFIASHITVPTFNTLIAHFLISSSTGHDALISFYKCPMNTDQQKNSIFIEVGLFLFSWYLVKKKKKKHFMSEK